MEVARDIVRLLKLRDLPDFHETAGGCLALRRTDIAPMAYEVAVNAPPDPATLDQIVSFAKGADEKMIRALYALCNGLKIGATKFAVYGVLSSVDRSDAIDAINTPWDLNIPNTYGRPSSWRENTLIVGVGTERPTDKAPYKVYHSVEDRACIRVSPADNFDKALRSYSTVGDWLSQEVTRALSDRNHY